ncbi:hypothetical protein PQQ99_20095 [Paraburkholderia sediminicola]|uniref:hypothetical protein n=1 Tax=Paraburkholderia sediminicola TaxID=458836 RepID=UPI0038B93181
MRIPKIGDAIPTRHRYGWVKAGLQACSESTFTVMFLKPRGAKYDIAQRRIAPRGNQQVQVQWEGALSCLTRSIFNINEIAAGLIMRDLRFILLFSIFSIFTQNVWAVCEDAAPVGYKPQFESNYGPDYQRDVQNLPPEGLQEHAKGFEMRVQQADPGSIFTPFYKCMAQAYTDAATQKSASQKTVNQAPNSRQKTANTNSNATADATRNHPQNVANRCIHTRRGNQGNFGYGIEMVNTCSYPVSVAWCELTKDGSGKCANGFDSMGTIDPGKSWPVDALEGKEVVGVRLGACKGANGMQDVNINNSKMRISCAAYPN